jgi:hypothetical protein
VRGFGGQCRALDATAAARAIGLEIAEHQRPHIHGGAGLALMMRPTTTTVGKHIVVVVVVVSLARMGALRRRVSG